MPKKKKKPKLSKKKKPSQPAIVEDDFGTMMERVLAILQIEHEEDAEATDDNMNKYLAYLQQHFQKHCLVTGREDFDWEEYYLLGPGDKAEYAEMKKIHPSYTDKFEVLEIGNHPDDMYGILVKVRRTSDKKIFALPLGDLETVGKQSENTQLLDDYAVWFTNFR